MFEAVSFQFVLLLHCGCFVKMSLSFSMIVLSFLICLRLMNVRVVVAVSINGSLVRACKDDVNLCLNNGTCYEHLHDGQPKYYCNCTTPYVGGICRSADSESEESSRKLILNGLGQCRADNKLCKNGGTCYSVVQTDRSFDQDQGLILYGCNCKRGFYGGYCQYNMSVPAIRTGEESNSCDPNPCMNECDCVLSCKHELGYYCVSDEGFVGKNCSIEVPAVSCETDSIIITISPNFYDEFDMGLNNSFFYLTPNADAIPTPTTPYANCSVRPEKDQRDALVFNLSLPFDECDMKFAMSDDVTIFTNTLWVNRENLGDGVDMPVRVIEWQCMYDRNYSVISRLQPVIHQDATLVREEGVFDVSLALCKVGACPVDCPDRYQVNSTAVYTIGQRIHLAIRTNFAGEQESDSGLVTTVTGMFLSCSADPDQPRLIDLVLNGCPHETAYGLSLDVTAGFIEAAQSACASFLLPRVTCDQFYVHVFVQICQRDALQTCAKHSNTKHCSSRRGRRSIAAKVSEHSTIGPISVIDGSAGSRLVQLYPDDGGRILYDRESTLFQSNQITEFPKTDGEVNVWILVFGAFGSLLLVSLVVVSKPLISAQTKPATDIRL